MITPCEVEILLVEDNVHDAELTLRSLKKRRFVNHIHWAKDGVEALEFIFGNPPKNQEALACRPKVILLDLKLPKVDGLEVLQRLKSNEQTKNIPVVVLTSSREQPDIDKCYALGVNSYIVKPVNFDNFSEAVSNLGMYWVLLNQSPPPTPNCPATNP